MTRYRTIVADPPWPFDWQGGPGGRRARATPKEYESMTIEAIEALPVADLVDDRGAHLFLWVTPQLHREGVGVRVARSWGFEPISEIIWAKPNFGAGAFPRSGHEPLLVCRRGHIAFTGSRDVHSVQRWRQRYDKNGGKRHSAKPEGAIDLIEQHSPGRYLELWSRRHRLGWDVWGNESANTATVEMA